jgi:hypothetical protein
MVLLAPRDPSFHVYPNNNPILYFLHVYPKNSPRINNRFISCMFSLEKNKDKRERRVRKGTLVLRSALLDIQTLIRCNIFQDHRIDLH